MVPGRGRSQAQPVWSALDPALAAQENFCGCTKGDLGAVEVTPHLPGSQAVHVNTLLVFSHHLLGHGGKPIASPHAYQTRFQFKTWHIYGALLPQDPKSNTSKS